MRPMEVANTILEQLGGRQFQAMTGASQFVGSKNSLSFRLPGAGGFCKAGMQFPKGSAVVSYPWPEFDNIYVMARTSPGDPTTLHKFLIWAGTLIQVD